MKFNYQARIKGGEIKKGIIEASSKEAASSLLEKHNFFVTYLEEVESAPFYAKRIKFFERVSRKEIVMFFRQLSIMFASHVPLVEALQTIANQTKNPDFKERILKITEDVDAGTTLSESFSRHPKIFTSFMVNMVKSGEVSGNLSKSLEYLADHSEREYELLANVRGAMIYPVLILAVALIIFSLMMIFVIPQLTEVLKETGQSLPLLTKLVIAFSDVFKQYFLIIMPLFLGSLGAIIYYFKTPKGKKVFDKNALKVPLVSSFLKMIYLSRFAENLSTLFSAGIPITQSLEITGNIVGNETYKNAILITRDEVRKGKQISEVLTIFPDLFPSVLIQLISAGEKTGTLDKILLKIVNFYQKEVDRAIKNFLTILEPILIIFLGLGVTILIMAIMVPIYQMSSF